MSPQQLEQQFVVELSPQEVKDCVLPLPMILTWPQSNLNLPKIHPLLLVFLTPSCGGSPNFIDYLDTQTPIPFMLTCFVAASTRVVDYATLHGRKPLFEHTECQAKDIENQALDGRQPIVHLFYFIFYFWRFLNLIYVLFYFFNLCFEF